MAEHLSAEDPELLDVEVAEDRYARLRLIPWWEQERLSGAKVMVVGAGALGNEICKSLALLGVGKVFLVDMDAIEDTNLTRSVLFRQEDEGEKKAAVAARAMREINPDIRVEACVGNILHDVGDGVFREMDIVFGALDNRMARVHVNAMCWQLGIPWVDGAIEVVQGVARLFAPPEGACYECTMSEMDYRLLNMRRSCALLNRDDIVEGKVPTTPTTASIIAGLQVQEAIKWLHRDRDGVELLRGKGFVFNGMTNDSYIVEYQRRDDCPAHGEIGEVIETDLRVGEVTAGQMLELVRREVSAEAVLEFGREICVSFHCSQCNERTAVFAQLSRLSGADAECPECGQLRDAELTHAIYGEEEYLDRTLLDLGLPLYDIVRGREGMSAKHFLLGGDRKRALGEIG